MEPKRVGIRGTTVPLHRAGQLRRAGVAKAGSPTAETDRDRRARPGMTFAGTATSRCPRRRTDKRRSLVGELLGSHAVAAMTGSDLRDAWIGFQLTEAMIVAQRHGLHADIGRAERI